MRKIIKIVKILIIFIVIILLLQNILYAMDTDITIGDTSAIRSSNGMTKRIVGILQVVGSVFSVAALAVIGIRYMISSLEERAQMKGVLVYYVVGAILVFATSNILSVVYNAISNITF